MEYILEITKIVDGAIKADRAKVSAYVRQMARKLDEAGDVSAAKRILACLRPQGGPELAPNDFGPPTRLPVDGESRLHLADEVQPHPEPPFVSLSQENQQKVDQFLRFVGAADRLIAGGVGISPSMLLYGPPGCGKTRLASHIASRLGLPLLVARSDSLISSYLGSTAKNLRSLFEHASSRPSVLFLDEFDAFAKVRDDQHELGELKRVVVSLLQNIDALDGRTVLLAASNHEHLLDAAVWRRFAYKLQLSLPDQSQREELFRQFLGSYSLPESIAILAKAAESLSGSQIRQISEDAVREALLADHSEANEISLLLQVARMRIPVSTLATDDSDADASLAKQIHALEPHVFNGKRLAAMLERSPGTISRWLRG